MGCARKQSSSFPIRPTATRIGVRRFADNLDEAKEKTLIKAGASEQLIVALKSGTYSLSTENTAATLKQMEAETQRRAEQAEAAAQTDARYRDQVIRERTAKPTSPTTGNARNTR